MENLTQEIELVRIDLKNNISNWKVFLFRHSIRILKTNNRLERISRM